MFRIDWLLGSTPLFAWFVMGCCYQFTLLTTTMQYVCSLLHWHVKVAPVVGPWSFPFSPMPTGRVCPSPTHCTVQSRLPPSGEIEAYHASISDWHTLSALAKTCDAHYPHYIVYTNHSGYTVGHN